LSILVILAGLMGAAGVVLAAAASHAATTVRLEPAAYLLLLHATALLAGAGVVDRGLAWRSLAMPALVRFALGAGLFAADLTLRAFSGNRLFPMAAPIGGFILILSWAALAVAAAISLARG
jgi:uncharacterized membrane protein YgdD (TMEM256/DUF423 family)